MIEVEITNYQSIAHTKLKIEGFTTLIGRNYLGKSAVLRAINAALTNQQGTKFIRWGQTFCEVRIKFPDLDILWHKEENNNFYEINNKRYDKIGKGDPPKEILEAGFKPVMLGDQKINLNYAVQFFPLFLVDSQDSRGADLLTSVYGLDRIYKAIELCNKEQRTNSDLLRIREKDLNQINSGLEKFEKFPNIAALIPSIKEKRKLLGVKETEIKKIKTWGESLKSLFFYCKRMKPVTEISIPDPEEISKSLDHYHKIVQYKKNVDDLMAFLKRVKPALDLDLPSKSIPDIKEMFADYQKLLKWQSGYRILSEEVSRLEKISDIKLPEVSIDVESIPNLKRMQDKLVTSSNDLKNIKKSLEEVAVEIEAVVKERDKFDICPLCGAKRQ